MDKQLLFNPDKDIQSRTAYPSNLFEQYKMYVELMDRISQRRSNANSFYITANAALLMVASWFKDDFGNYVYLISAIGIALAIFWFFTINSYKQLNTGKFKVIHEIESQLPLRLFEYEWKLLSEGKNKKIYFPISHIEKVVPFIFCGLYVLLSIFNCLSW
jgi:hypothetical protein